MAEKVPPHVGLHPGSHDMSPGGDVILAEIPDDINYEKPGRRKENDLQHVVRPLTVHLVKKIPYQYREKDINP